MLIYINAKPNSREEKIEKISDSEYNICVKEPAENNKANIRIINLLSKEFNVNFRKIKIKNPKSRRKLIDIHNKD